MMNWLFILILLAIAIITVVVIKSSKESYNLSSDMSDPYRDRYPIDLPSPAYPPMECDCDCVENIKYTLQ
jgi:hypothetical protein